MAEICPAVLASTPAEYKKHLTLAEQLSDRVQIDITDGVFAPGSTVKLEQVYFSEDTRADLHLMLQKPISALETAISLNPNLVIVHAEAEGDLPKLLQSVKEVGIQAGIALLPDTQPQDIEDLLKTSDHALVFGGHLGSYGGELDESVLPKMSIIKQINPDIEIGYDGGVNDSNAAKIISAGADVLSVGSFIQKADDPQKAYDKLIQISKGVS